MKKIQWTKTFILWFLAALAVLSLVQLSRHQSIRSYINTSSAAIQTQTFLHDQEYAFGLLMEAESAARGYIISGEDHYLQAYYTSIRQLPDIMQNLREFSAATPSLRKKIDAIGSLFDQRLEILHREISLRRDRGFSAAQEFVLTDTGEEMTREISSLQNELNQSEHSSLANRFEATKGILKETYRTSLLSISVTFIFFFLAFLFLLRENSRRRLAEKELHVLNTELECRVRNRTAQIARQRNELNTRTDILEILIQERDLQGSLDKILRKVIEFFGVEFGCIFTVVEKEILLTHWYGITDAFRSQILSFNAEDPPEFLRHATLLHEQLSEQGQIPHFAVHDGIQAWMTVPLILQAEDTPGKSDWLGSVILCSSNFSALTEDDARILKNMGQQLSLAIDRARSHRNARERLHRLKVLHEIDKGIIQHKNLDEVLRIVLERVPEDLGADAVAISLFEEKGSHSKVCAFRRPNGVIINEDAFQLADSLLHWFCEKQETVIIHDLSQDPRLTMNRELIRSGKLFSYLGVPLIVQEATIGILHIMTTRAKKFADDDIAFFRTLAGQAAIAITNVRSTERLRKSEEQYRTLFEQSKDAVFISTREGKFLDINPAGLELFGYATKEEVLGLDITRDLYCNPKDREELIRRMESRGYVKNLEMELKRKDGEKIIVLNTSTAVYNEQGNVVAYRGIIRDESKRIASEQFIRNILESVGEGIIVLDDHYRILSANRAYAELTRKPLKNIIGRHCFTVSHHRDRPCFEAGELCAVKETFATGRPATALHKHTDRQGNVQYLEVKAYPMKDRQGTTASVIEVVTDVTEKQKLQEQLGQAQKMEAIGQLTGGIAHDFNNILTTILGYGDLLKANLRHDDAQPREYADTILFAAKRAAELTKSLLAFSRRQIIKLQPVDLNEIVKRSVLFLSRVIGEHITLETILTDMDCAIMADSVQIEQVLMNLATNARDAMPEGGHLTLETSLATIDPGFVRKHGFGVPGRYALLTVADSGVGFDERTRQKIFDPFFTTKEIGKGTGLGLSMVYGTIKQHDGFINVYSEPEKGTTFRIYLPAMDHLVEAKGEKTSLPPLPRGTETLLVAEDDADVRALTCNTLKEFGYTVIEAVDGEEAVNRFMEHSKQVRLLVLDIIMPNMNGKEAYLAIKKIAPDIKTLFLSGHTANLIHKEGILDKGFAFLSKPYSISALLQNVRKVLDD